eukprot:m.48878 g.48878  ORF g.48878 m.48878 type:complete len:377 (-) comp7421_c0_seq1:267-1397(-)
MSRLSSSSSTGSREENLTVGCGGEILINGKGSDKTPLMNEMSQSGIYSTVSSAILESDHSDDEDDGEGEYIENIGDGNKVYLIIPSKKEQRKHVAWYRGESAMLIYGGIFLLAVGLIFGYATPIPNDLKEKNMEIGRLSNVLGGIYFIAWSLSFYPQIYLNYRLKSTVGMSYDYQLYNIIGFTCYSLFNCMFFFSPIVQQTYRDHHGGKNNQVQASDVFFSVHALVLTIVTCIQIIMYERGTQKISLFCWIVSGLSVTIAVLFVILCAAYGKSIFTWLNFYELIADIKLVVTVIKYIPQVYMNYKRKKTVGMNIHNFLLDLVGGLFSTTQLCMDAGLTNDWSAVTGDIAKFGLGSTAIVYDIIIIIQHYIIYRGAS